ncbi:acetyltransferase [Litorilituus lipolyticus]|uniref:Acetyltransferase n=1 Tax=Litorilituus lipolyticus TaxID=2491017 RepID=A0A502L1I7_9GAMM|nr:acetyltransferase [Litorilituus lipolyticus]TPH17054.1 acetyltransferase [Litorilituus lipolyticus]
MNKNHKLIIYGIGPFAKLMHFYFSADSNYEVLGFCVDRKYISTHSFCDLPVLPFEDIDKKFSPEEYKMFVAIGYRCMRNRRALFKKAKDLGYNLANYISSNALKYSNFKLGENNVIMGGCNVEPFVVIGNNNVIWSDTLLGHDLVIGDHNYISAKCLIAGNCYVGDLCFIGNGVTTIDGLNINDESFLISGAVLTSNTEKFGRYKGIPAKHSGSHSDYGIVITRG